MNITALRPRFKQYLEPIAGVFIRCGITPNQCSFLALIAGIFAAVLFMERLFLAGSLFLLLSAIFDLVDGSIARRTNSPTKFGAVFDWIVDKYVDALVILGVGLSGIPDPEWNPSGAGNRRLCHHRSCHYRLPHEHVYQTRCLRRGRVPGKSRR